MTSPSFDSLPVELQATIIAFEIDFDNKGPFATVSNAWSRLVGDDRVWRIVAERIGFYPLAVKQGGMYEKVKEHCLAFRQNIKQFQNLPVYINPLLEHCTVKNIEQIKRWLKQKDLILIWQKLAENIANSDFPYLEDFTSLQDIETVSDKFKAWLTEHKDELSLIKEISFRNDKLTTFPDIFYFLSSLERLQLNNNLLYKIPASIGELKNLKFLDLSNNKIISIPVEINGLSSLKNLNLSNNSLHFLPNLENLKNLNCLYAANNNLTLVPIWIKNLNKLMELNLEGNKITSIPEWLLELGIPLLVINDNLS